jgi:uncharacterized membrane protein YhaH (DUF805 family)
MNPFKGSITRTGFLLWSIVCIMILVTFGLRISFSQASYSGIYLPIDRVIFVSLVFWSIGILILLRRLQNAGLSAALALLLLCPVAGQLLCIALFFIPAKAKK